MLVRARAVQPVVYFRTYCGAAHKAVQHGFMTPREAKAVILAACADFRAHNAPLGDGDPAFGGKWMDLQKDISHVMRAYPDELGDLDLAALAPRVTATAAALGLQPPQPPLLRSQSAPVTGPRDSLGGDDGGDDDADGATGGGGAPAVAVFSLAADPRQALGLSLSSGLAVTTVVGGSPSAAGGVTVGCRVLAVEGRKVDSVEGFKQALAAWRPAPVEEGSGGAAGGGARGGGGAPASLCTIHFRRPTPAEAEAAAQRVRP